MADDYRLVLYRHISVKRHRILLLDFDEMLYSKLK